MQEVIASRESQEASRTVECQEAREEVLPMQSWWWWWLCG